MSSIVLEKMNRLTPELKVKLSEPDFLSRLDAIGSQYGVKEILILLDLLLGETAEKSLIGRLKTEYGFNDFLAQEVASKFAVLLKELRPKSVVQEKQTIETDMFGETKMDDNKNKTAKTNDTEQYAQRAETIIANSGFSGDDVLIGRLRNIIIAKLRGVRDDIETLESLTKNKKVGGLEFTTEQAESLLQLTNGIPVAKTMTREAKATPRHTLPADFALDFGDELEEDEDEEDQESSIKSNNSSKLRIEEEGGLPVVRMPANLPKSSTKSEIKSEKYTVPTANELPTARKNDKINQEDGLQKKDNVLPTPRPTPVPYDMDKNFPPPAITRVGNRPTLDGIKVERRLSGPIEELENLTMIDFRRISADSTIAVNKIKEKIDLLEEEGFAQKMEGIDAWHRSEVNKFYRLLGQASMTSGQPIEQVIKERLFSGKPTLSIDEFHAIMELNRALRY